MNEIFSKPAQRVHQSDAAILDSNQALTLAGGDCGHLIQLCAKLLGELPVHTARLREALKLRETLPAERAIQKLNGSLALLGTGPLTQTLEDLALFLRSGERKKVRAEWLRLQSQLDLLVPQVQLLMLEMSPSDCTVQ